MKEHIDAFPNCRIDEDYPVKWLLETSKYEPLRKIIINYKDLMELVSTVLIGPG